MAKLLYKWSVYFQPEGSGLRIFKGHKWAPSEASACNKMRAQVWGRETPYDQIGGVLLAEEVKGCPPIQPKPRQRPLPGV